MIFYWLALLGDFVVRLFAPVKPRDVARIDVNHPCPCCNFRKGKIRTVKLMRKVGGRAGLPEIFIEHTCQQCGARWFEATVVRVGPDLIMPGLPRTQLELAADDSYGVPLTIRVDGEEAA
jgi:hypothetical protein